MNDDACPTDAALRRLLATVDSGGADASVQAHLDRCEDCQGRLERLASVSPVDDALRGALATAPPNSSRLIATIDQLSHQAEAAGETGAPRYDDLAPWIVSSTDGGGETLDGFTLLECIGRGGMGVVFRAADPTQARVVALKAMLPELARDDRARKRFLREARAIAAVRHPNVVALRAVSEVEGLPYLIMDHVEGGSLDDRLRSGPPLAPDEIVKIGAAIASGLAACHAEGIIHRDIKPSNVLLGETDDAVKITDFGLAVVASTPKLTHHGYLPGTPDYVAPERLVIGADADERSDLFSLGCLLYKMATGDEPFGGDTPLITLHRIATDQPPPIRTKNPSIPGQLERAIAWLMEKRPEDRPPSAEVARDALLEGPPRQRKGQKSLRRGAVMVLLLGAIGIASVAWSPQDLETPGQDSGQPSSLSEAATDGNSPVDLPTNLNVTTAAELESAVQVVLDGGRIEIDTDATLVVSPLFIDRKSVSIVAVDGRKPTIRLKVDEEGPAPEYLLRLNYGTLILDGLRLHDTWEPEQPVSRERGQQTAAEDYSLLSLEDADLEVRSCRLETRAQASCVTVRPGNSSMMTNTSVFAPSGTAITFHAVGGDGLELHDCVVAGDVGIVAVVDGYGDTTWKRSTVLANTAALKLRQVRGELTAYIIDCTIQSVEALVVGSIESPSLKAFKRALVWKGARNRINGHRVVMSDGADAPPWGREVSSWAATDRESTYQRQLFTVSHKVLVRRLIGGEDIADFILDKDAK